MNRRRSERIGRRAEHVAAWWLRLQGWRILGRRVKVPVGEIDLIARRGHVLVFIEVKARASAAQSALALDEWGLKRVARAVEAVAHLYQKPGDTLRIDAVFIIPWRLPRRLVNVLQGR